MSTKPTYTDVLDFLISSDNFLADDAGRIQAMKEMDDDVKRDDQYDAVAALRIKKDCVGDELDFIETIMSLESEYNIEIEDDWLAGHGDDPTLGELAKLVVDLAKKN